MLMYKAKIPTNALIEMELYSLNFSDIFNCDL